METKSYCDQWEEEVIHEFHYQVVHLNSSRSFSYPLVP